MNQVIMPRVGMHIMSATIVEWKKKPGDLVKKREPLMVIDTGLAVIEFASLFDGILKTILVHQGEVPCGTLLALIGDEDEVDFSDENNKSEY